MKKDPILRILVVDDDAIVRNTINLMIQRKFPTASISLCSSLEDASKTLDQHEFNIVILDLNLDRQTSLNLLHKYANTIPILVISSRKEEDVAVSVIKAGAKGFICKDNITDSHSLAEAIKLLIDGKTYISSNLAHNLINKDSITENAALSEQEMNVLRLIGTGFTVKDIAADMQISEKTVRTYRVRILKKLTLNSDNDIIRYAIQSGIVN